MRDPNNILQVEYSTEQYTVLKMKEVPEFDLEDYDLFDPKELNKYFSDIEKVIRTSFEYKEMVKYLRENMDMNKCSFFENVTNIDTTKIKIHIHHHPFTLFDLVVIVYNKRVFYGESINLEMVAKEVMFMHYNLYVGLIPLSETVHELVHNMYLFIPMDKAMGKFRQFKEMYNEFMTPEQVDTWDRNIQFSDSFNEDLYNNNIIQKKYVYLDVTGNYALPSYEDIVDIMNKKIKSISSGADNQSSAPAKKCIVKTITGVEPTSLYFGSEE